MLREIRSAGLCSVAAVLSRIKDQRLPVEPAASPAPAKLSVGTSVDLAQWNTGSWSIDGICIGDSDEQVRKLWGQPDSVLDGSGWRNTAYRHPVHRFIFENGRVTAVESGRAITFAGGTTLQVGDLIPNPQPQLHAGHSEVWIPDMLGAHSSRQVTAMTINGRIVRIDGHGR
jgi:hypothetical protein